MATGRFAISVNGVTTHEVLIPQPTDEVLQPAEVQYETLLGIPAVVPEPDMEIFFNPALGQQYALPREENGK